MKVTTLYKVLLQDITKLINIPQRAAQLMDDEDDDEDGNGNNKNADEEDEEEEDEDEYEAAEGAGTVPPVPPLPAGLNTGTSKPKVNGIGHSGND